MSLKEKSMKHSITVKMSIKTEAIISSAFQLFSLNVFLNHATVANQLSGFVRLHRSLGL
jgi:hypothetical protein